tara:strand:+ start:4811 stop:5479 length:669 start_codon:yes stop_codon:yes gene_type:complete
MGIFATLFGNNKKLPFKKTIRFERNNYDLEINIGDKLNIWNKPNTQQVNLYVKGSSAGDGLIGTTTNSIISHHLNRLENIGIDNKVVGITKNSIDLFVHIYIDNEIIQKNQQDYKNEWIEKLNKKYNPKSSWKIRFYSEIKIGKNDFLIKTINKSQIEEYYERGKETIWLIDKKGQNISAENQIGTVETERTLRAVFSGHELEIINFKKDYHYYYIEIGIKK